MIISHKYRFIFLKTRRTGGSSFEKAVAPFLGDEDIATGSKRDGTPRQNIDDDTVTGHIPWWRIEEIAGVEAFENYFKFCFERNSYEKAVSEWQYKCCLLGETKADLYEWTVTNPVSDIKKYYHGFGDGDLKFTVFQYCPFTYVPTVRGLLATLGIPPAAINNIHLKSTHATFPSYINHRRFRAIIENVFAAEIKIFGYKDFGGEHGPSY